MPPPSPGAAPTEGMAVHFNMILSIRRWLLLLSIRIRSRYRYSRTPYCNLDIHSLAGWTLLSASMCLSGEEGSTVSAKPPCGGRVNHEVFGDLTKAHGRV
ncbi:hypothetical protein LY76DRAFT_411581 [Colletotrichum caudatum]|nr:hypothetical protein LY76DRAFT_411581 [Colletotrichum caudatum]